MGYYLLFAVIVAAYAWRKVSLHFWPYAPCRWCRGRKGNSLGSRRGRWGDCSRCDGKGKRLRWGARG
jgi:hypothetical protein